MSNHKEIRQLVKQLQGMEDIEVKLGRSNHYKVYRINDDGSRTMIATLPNSPSSYRSYMNTVAYLRRAGVAV